MTDRKEALPMVEIAKRIYRDDGLSGFARGLGVRTLGTTVITMVLFACYEPLKVILHPSLTNDQEGGSTQDK